MHHPPAADRVIRRPALPHREAGVRRENEDLGAAADAEERTREIARMMSGAKLTDTSLKHAEQMLKANR